MKTIFHFFTNFFCQVFNQNTSYDFLYNKYDTSYLGSDLRYLGFLALNKIGEAVSYCGTIPFVFSIGEKNYMGAHSCDHMTRNDARKKGLFLSLNERADELCSTMKIPFVFGFPNQNNNPILVKYAKWQIIDHMHVLELKTGALPLSSLAGKKITTKKMYEKFVQKKIINKQSSDRIRHNSWPGIARDNDFYRYKTYSKNFHIRLRSGLCWFKIEGAFLIGDLQTDQGSSVHDLLNDIRTFARSLSISKVLFLFSGKHPYAHQILDTHPTVKGNAVGIKPLNNEDLDYKSLHFSWGDYDTF